MAKSVLISAKDVSNFLKHMEFVESASPQTIRAYRADLARVFPESVSFTENQLLSACRRALSQQQGLSSASRNRKVASMKSFFNFLFEKKLISKRLSDFLISPKVAKKLPHFLSLDETLAALKVAEGPSRLLFLLLYGGGLRVSEACGLQWSQIDLRKNVLRILGKGGKERLVAVPPIVLQTANKMKTSSTFVWGEKALPTRTAYEMIRKIGVQAGLLRPLHPHVLRHSFATHMLISGANLRTLQEQLGHTSLRATEKYTHLDLDQLARTMDQHHPLGNKES